MVMNNEFASIWKNVEILWLQLISWHSVRATGKTTQILSLQPKL